MEIKTDVSYLKNTKCSDVYTESQTDYILPDYLGDMRKILFTDATLRPSGRFAGGDEVEFSGVVVYNVIYLDSEGALSSVEFTSDYDYTVKCSGESYNDSIANTRVSNYAVRLIGPRKISARASLVGSVRLSENSAVSVSGNAFEGDITPEINRGSLKIRASRTSSVVEREYAEALARLDGAIADEVSVVYPNVEIFVEDVRAEEDSVTLKGKIRMCAMIKNGDEAAYSAEKQISFEEKLDFEDADGMLCLIPQLTVCSVSASVNADEGGCEVVMSGIAELCVIGEGNQSVEVMLDGYLKDCPTDNFYEEMKYTMLVSAACQKLNHNCEISRDDLESEGLREIIFLTAIPKLERVEWEDGCAKLYGEIRFSGIASEMIGDKISYTGIKFSSPFEENVNVNCQNSDKLRVEADVKAQNCSATLDADRLYASCVLDCSVVAIEDCNCRTLSSMTRREGESYDSGESVVTVYYPTDSDTLFSVAKRFHTSSLKVARDNDISDAVFAADNPTGSLSGVKKLIIF